MNFGKDVVQSGLTTLGSAYKFARSGASDVQEYIQNFGSILASSVEPLSNPGFVLEAMAGQDLRVGEIRYGIIQHATPHMGTLKVKLQNGGEIIARESVDGAIAGGVRKMSTLPIGTGVYVLVDPATRIGTVLSVVADPLIDRSQAFCDSIVAGSGVGFYASPQYRDYVSVLADGGQVKPFKGDRPIDSLPGDYTMMSVEGVGLHIDSEMAFLRTSEVCGITVFREDGHTRVSGESLTIESDSYLHESGMSVMECFCETSESIYPWETIGQVKSDYDVTYTQRGPEVAYGEPYATIEPAEVNAKPLGRIESFGGYLGQGQLTVVSAPQGDGVHTMNNPAQRFGLFREQVMLDGTYLVESANQLFFAKTADVPVLTRTSQRDYRSEASKYVHSGKYGLGNGEQHEVSQLTADDPVAVSMAVEDVYAYASGWQGLHVAGYDENIQLSYRATTTSPLDVDLSQSDYVEQTDGEEVEIDHRYESITLHRLLSLFAILPNGDIVLQNGLGAEIRLAGGVVDISGTGVHLSSAKTVSILSSQVAIRGQQDVELVSSKRDVRIKADRNINMLAGVSYHGGVLIESRARTLDSEWKQDPAESYSTGITLKSASSHVTMLGGDVVLKTGDRGANLLRGYILIDAGDSTVVTRAGSVQRYSRGGYYDHFGSSGSVSATNIFQRGYSRISGSFGLTGQLIVGGGVQANQGFTTATGHYASTKAVQFQGRVGLEINPGLIQQNIAQLQAGLFKATETGRETNRNVNDRLSTGEKRPINSVNIGRTSFGFPSSESYGATNLKIRQPLWQRKYSSSTQKWDEPQVSYQESEPTRPWPGDKRWKENDSLIYIKDENSFLDPASQTPLDPSDPANRKIYAKGELRSTLTDSLLEGYRTLRIT